jgi:hypothetical protein
MKVQIKFDFYPDEPDPNDDTGMSADEHDRVIEQLMALGADSIEIEKVEE